jgi:hypothetical protein
MKNRQPSLMVHTNPEFENFKFDQHLGSHKHVINILMWFRDMGHYTGHQMKDCEEFLKWLHDKRISFTKGLANKFL